DATALAAADPHPDSALARTPTADGPWTPPRSRLRLPSLSQPKNYNRGISGVQDSDTPLVRPALQDPCVRARRYRVARSARRTSRAPPQKEFRRHVLGHPRFVVSNPSRR